jgi:hypothetical protein
VDIKKGKAYLTEKDLQNHSIWIRHESDDLIYPVLGLDDLPEDMSPTHLKIKAKFKVPNGLEFNGYIMGIKNIYCIVIFWEQEILYLNKNLLNDCLEAINKINSSLNLNLQLESYFPLKFETVIDVDVFKDISGEFDIFKKRTEEERLASYGIE